MNAKTKTLTQSDTAPLLQTTQDMKNALLVVSLVINLFIFTAWLVVQVDPTIGLAIVQAS